MMMTKLPDVVFNEADAKFTQEEFGELRFYFEGPTDLLKAMTAGSVRLNPGATPHPPHQHVEEEFMVVTEGSGVIELEGKFSGVGPGSMMYCAAWKWHAIVNTGTVPLHFYFYKWVA